LAEGELRKRKDVMKVRSVAFIAFIYVFLAHAKALLIFKRGTFQLRCHIQALDRKDVSSNLAFECRGFPNLFKSLGCQLLCFEFLKMY
jgi:hypothetical protein